jgi:tetratricopeptide (TPR) repeat protein
VDWLGCALSETVASGLEQLGELKVIGGSQRARLLATPDVQGPADWVRLALRLGVRWVVMGQYQRAEHRLRVAVRIVDASTGVESRASESFGTIDELLSQPHTLTASIVEALALPRLAPAKHAERRARAVELHFDAQRLWQTGDRSHPRVFALLDEALAVSADFVPALSLRAAAYATSFITSQNPDDLMRAIASADRALALDPRCVEALSWRAYALLRLQRVDEALRSSEQAVQAGEDPTSFYTYGSMLASLGRFEAALPHLQHAVTLEPKFGIAWLSLGWTLHSLLRGEAAAFALARAKALEGQPGPTFVAGVGGYIAECLRSLGELDFARAEALAGLESIERSDHAYRDTIRAFCLCALGRAGLAQRDFEGARAAFAQAVAQMRGRTRTQAGGHVFVQALAGQARATGDRECFIEAVTVFETRDRYSFNSFFGCSDDVTALELALAADALGLPEDAQRFLARARAAGSRQPFTPPSLPNPLQT